MAGGTCGGWVGWQGACVVGACEAWGGAAWQGDIHGGGDGRAGMCGRWVCMAGVDVWQGECMAAGGGKYGRY